MIPNIKPMIADDGKEYYIGFISSRSYRYIKRDYWQEALEQAKRQLSRVQYHRLNFGKLD